MDLGLAGKRALVLGGNRGIGFGIAKALADEGADVLIAARDKARLAAAAEELRTARPAKSQRRNRPEKHRLPSPLSPQTITASFGPDRYFDQQYRRTGLWRPPPTAR